jgi:hypothetical protein
LFVWLKYVVCLHVEFLVFILLGILWNSWICGLVFIINFENFLALFKYFWNLNLSCAVSVMHMMYHLELSYCSLIFCSIHSLFFLHFGFASFYWSIFKFTDSFLGCVHFTTFPAMEFFISVMVFFDI